MKKISYFVAQFAITAAVIAAMPSCSGSSESETAKDATKKEVAKAQADTAKIPSALSIRYVDDEKLMEEYNLAKDFKESIQRSQSKLISAQQSRENELQQIGSQIESKMKSNSYTSESEYNADIARVQKKQQDAQNYLGNLQRTTELEISQLQNQLQDSIQSYIKIFSEQNGYDAVLMKSAGLYFNPALDVTEEVVKGLNSRYNKVAK